MNSFVVRLTASFMTIYAVSSALLVPAKSLATPTYPQSFQYYGKLYPSHVTLEDFFPDSITRQKGRTCHIFSAASLFEAACFKKTGRKVKLSEAYLYYRHLQGKLSKMNAYPLMANPKPGEILAIDAGDERQTLRRILNHSAVADSEFEFSSSFIGAIKKPLAGIRQRIASTASIIQKVLKFSKEESVQASTEAFSKKMVPTLSDELDHYVSQLAAEKRFTLKQGSRIPGFLAVSNDEDLQACFQARYEIHETEFTEKAAVDLIADGIPFLCSGTFQFPTEEEAEAHVSTVIGYRYNEGAEGKIQYLFRDSNLSTPIWGSGQCNRITYLQ